MADVKRLNYFNTQYLEENDFKDEQKYHLEMRRLHNKRFHTPGIAYGLAVTRTGGQSISVSPGMALDNEGREMVQLDAFPLNLSDTTLYPPNSTIYVTIAYDEKATDPQPKDAASPRGMTRMAEKPKIQAVAVPPNAAPPNDGSVIQLAKFSFTGGNVPAETQFDDSVRVTVGAVLADKSVSIKKLKTTLVPGSDTLTLAAGGRATLRAFEAPLSSASSAFLVVYAYSITPGANFRWEQGYSTEGTQSNLKVVQTVTFSHSGSFEINVKYKIYVVLES
jgi:hypothetical protein